MISVRDGLKEDFEKRKLRNPAYSLRAFARDLGLDHASLSQILSGKRRISKANFEKIAQALHLTDDQVKQLKHEVDLGLESYSTLDDQLIARKNRWYLDAICELTRLEDFEPSVPWVAQALGLSESEVQEAVDLLTALGELRVSKDKWEVVEFCTTTLSGTKMSNLDLASAVRQCQRGFMSKQIEAFEKFPFEEMSHYGLTLAFDPDKLPEIRQKLIKTIREISREAESGQTRQRRVYRLNLSFFPVSD
ncbi:MAG: TIGR02147 family protein [Bdellovibrionaceae bacterium]|nr:TIGR02147 family protein [Bdellovibrionales bacterium]MCB9083953.1 TIGR02147 family protein [Pseudobdellovibrionaceae bacterium]